MLNNRAHNRNENNENPRKIYDIKLNILYGYGVVGSLLFALKTALSAVAQSE